MDERFRAILIELGDLLEIGDDRHKARWVRQALSGSDETLDVFLVSNELWGGMGSIADEALLSDKILRKTFEDMMIRLGRLQIETGRTNARTAIWVAHFEHCRKLGLS